MFVIPKTKVRNSKAYTRIQESMIHESYYKYRDLFKDIQLKDSYLKREIIVHISSFTMRIKKTRLGLYTCSVKIQGKRLNFLIDTGAQMSTLFKQACDDILFLDETYPIHIGSIGGKENKSECRVVETMFFGMVEIKNQPLAIMDSNQFMIPYLNVRLMNFDGIIGWDILRHLDFELNDKDSTFSLLSTSRSFRIQNLMDSSFPIFLALDHNQKVVTLGLDTGAKESWLGEHYAKQANVSIDYNQKAMGMGILGIETLHFWLIDHVVFSLFDRSITLKNTMTGRVDMFPNIEIDGVVGNKSFKNRRLQVFSSKRYIRIV